MQAPLVWASFPIIAAWLACAAMWVFFASRGVLRAVAGTARGPAPTLLAELSLLVLLYGFARRDPGRAVFGLIFPPAFLLFIPDMVDFDVIIGRFALVAIPVAALCLLSGRLILRRSSFLVLPAICVAFLAGGFAVDRLSKSAMCETATASSLTAAERHSFWWSLANTPREFQFEIHAIAWRGDDRFGWSYAQMDWYPLTDTVWGDVSGGQPVCN